MTPEDLLNKEYDSRIRGFGFRKRIEAGDDAWKNWAAIGTIKFNSENNNEVVKRVIKHSEKISSKNYLKKNLALEFKNWFKSKKKPKKE